MFGLWKNLTIQTKMLTLCSLFVLILAGFLAQSLYLSDGQESDGPVINMAGRQRMLTQAMTKAGINFLHSNHQGDEARAEASRKECTRTMEWFDVTLAALQRGGKVPLGKDQYTELPPCGDPEIADQLTKVARQWEPFQGNLSSLLGSAPSTENLEYVLDQNLPLCGVMNQAVAMLEAVAQAKVAQSVHFSVIAFCVGLLVTGMVLWVMRRWIVRPLLQSVDFVRNVTSGTLTDRLQIDQRDETGMLADSLNQMLTHICNSDEDSRVKLEYLNRLPTPAFAVDTEYTVQFMDKAGADMLGMSTADIQGKKCYDLFQSSICNTPDCPSQKAMKEGKVNVRESLARPGGKDIPCHFASAPLKNEDGSISGALEYVLDVTQQKEIQSGVKGGVDILGMVVSDVTAAVEEMNRKSQRIAEQSDTVATAAGKMSATMTSVSKLAGDSTNSITAVASATEEMTSTVEDIAQNSEKARTITESAVQSVTGASEKVNELGEAAQEISKVIETIVEIAEQTKLLALNATIEAARAGEAGKGFAVVASEVKELAKQTNIATEDIRSKIQAIQQSSESTVTEIGTIQTVICDVDAIVSSIATAVEEQSITTKDISGNISQASQGVQDMVERVLQSTEVAQEVTQNISLVNGDIRDVNDTSTQLASTIEQLRETGDSLTQVVAQFEQH